MTHLTDRQLTITLAALRYIQGHLYDSPMFAAEQLRDSDPIVKPEEIDEICDLINDPGFQMAKLAASDATTDDSSKANITTLDGVQHKVDNDSVYDFIIQNKGNLRKIYIPMRRPPTTLPNLEPDEEHF